MPGNWGLTRIVRLLYPCSFSNLCYGYVAFWTKRVDALRCGCDGFEIETLINVRALKSRPKIVEVAGFETPRLTRAGNLRAVPDGIRVTETILRERLTPAKSAVAYGLSVTGPLHALEHRGRQRLFLYGIALASAAGTSCTVPPAHNGSPIEGLRINGSLIDDRGDRRGLSKRCRHSLRVGRSGLNSARNASS